MPAYILLLRAVNVGGTGKLPMAELKAICEGAGFSKVRTYIASGNVVFESSMAPKKIRAAIESRLHAYAGKPVGVHIRTLAEMEAILKANPFHKAAPNRTVAIFLEEAPRKGALGEVTGLTEEELHLGVREIYVTYGDGMAHSKLRIPVAKTGTARNMNTVAKLVALASALGK
jgi:uncharacterized protein (DUF1697 family)